LESNEKLLSIAGDFGWTLTQNQDAQIPLTFAIHFTVYLRNIHHLQDAKWKLVNRFLTNGRVYLSKHEIARLLQEEVQRRIEKRLETPEQQPAFPAEILAIAERINALAKERICDTRLASFTSEVSQSAFPPCILKLHATATKGGHLSHIDRFTLASFLIALGASTEKVEEVFKNIPDHDAQITHYQVKHLESSRYKPPSCSTLQTHGVCSGKSDLCLKIRHPLAYYRLKSLEPKPCLKAS
jgi:DNA primase large subunit